jgi:hypothetical protein
VAIVVAIILFGCDGVGAMELDSGVDAGSDAGGEEASADAAVDPNPGFCFYSCQPQSEACAGVVHLDLLCSEQGWICCEP